MRAGARTSLGRTRVGRRFRVMAGVDGHTPRSLDLTDLRDPQSRGSSRSRDRVDRMSWRDTGGTWEGPKLSPPLSPPRSRGQGLETCPHRVPTTLKVVPSAVPTVLSAMSPPLLGGTGHPLGVALVPTARWPYLFQGPGPTRSRVARLPARDKGKGRPAVCRSAPVRRVSRSGGLAQRVVIRLRLRVAHEAVGVPLEHLLDHLR